MTTFEMKAKRESHPASYDAEINAYIWDLDGTLLDSYHSIVSSLVEVSGEPFEEIMKAVKRGAVSSYLRGYAQRSGEDYAALYQRYREISHGKMEEITLIPGAAETLQALQNRGAKHFVYTHRGKSTAGILDRLGLTPFFTEIVTFENGFKPKPSGEGVAYLIEKYGLEREKTAYVGDRTLDVQCAKDAGVRAILYLPPDSWVEETGAEDRIIRKLEELNDNRTAL